jgi:hypothetical protein
MICDALAEATKHGATKCLLDDRDLTLEVGKVDIYTMPEAFDKLEISREYKVAIVLPAVSKNVEDFKFYETRAANMAYKYRLFTDPDAALGWFTDRGT